MKRHACHTFNLLTLATLCAFSLASCRAPSARTTPAAQVWSPIAAIDGSDDIAQKHVANLLARHGIASAIEGSVVYGVSVPEPRAAEAIALLDRDARAHPYHLALTGGAAYDAPADQQVVLHPRRRGDELLRSPDYAEGTDLGAVLRHTAVQRALLAFPYVSEIRTLERSYFADATGRRQIGHDIRLELLVTPDQDIGGSRLWFRAWAAGQHVATHGSNEWWSGEPDVVAANRKKYDRRR